MLIDKLKFDLRVYVLVTSVDPLEVFVCKEGLARFCTEEYEAPAAKNMHNVMSHLTNYSLNKRSDKFTHEHHDTTEEEALIGETGSKRFLSSTLRQLEEKGFDV